MISDDSNGSNATEKRVYVEYSDRPETYIVPIVFGVIFVCGVLGNGGLVWIICRNKSMRSVPNMFILNLAVGDLLLLLVALPFTSTIYTFDSWPYGELICKASEFVKDTSIGVSVFTLVALSADRYSATVRSVQSFVGGTKQKQVAASLAAIWAASVSLAMPGVLFSHLLPVNIGPFNNRTDDSSFNDTAIAENRTIFVCYPFPQEFGPDYGKHIIMMRAVLHYALPLIVIATYYGIMAHHLLRSVKAIPGQATLSAATADSAPQDAQAVEPCQVQQRQLQAAQSQSRRKVVKMVLSLVVLFAVCFLPIHAFMLWFFFDPNAPQRYNHFAHCFKIIGFVMAYTNSCINPIALYCTSTIFRRHFQRLLILRDADAGVPLPASGADVTGPMNRCNTMRSTAVLNTRTSEVSSSSANN